MKDGNIGLSYFTNLILALFVVILLIVVSFYRSANATAALSSAIDVKNDIHKILLSIQDAETGQRGYIITLEEPYLQPFKDAKEEYSKNVEAVRKDISDNLKQKACLKSIDSLAQIKFIELELTISLVKNGEIDKSVAIIKADNGKKTMDAIRVLIDEMIDTENDFLALQKSKSRVWKYVIIILIIISMLIILFSIFRLYQNIKPLFEDLIQTKEKLQKVNVNLSESLFNFKKATQEKEEESIEKGKVIQRNEQLIEQLRLHQEELDQFTQLAKEDLNDLSKELSKRLDALQKANQDVSDENRIYISKIKATISKIKAILTKLDIKTS